jgi:hypothetical protein
VASLEANWRGADNPRLEGTEARLQALFTEESTRVPRTFRQVRRSTQSPKLTTVRGGGVVHPTHRGIVQHSRRAPGENNLREVELIEHTHRQLGRVFACRSLRFRQVLAAVLDELDWFPSQRNLTMFWGISGNPSKPEVEMDQLDLPFARLRDEGDEEALAGTVALPGDKPTQQKRSRGAIEAEVEELQLAAGAFSGLLEEVVQDMAVEAARDVLEPLLEEFADDLAAAKDRTKKCVSGASLLLCSFSLNRR